MIHENEISKPGSTHARNAGSFRGLLVPLATLALLANIFVQLVNVVRKMKCGSSSTKVFGSHVVVFKVNLQELTAIAKTIVDSPKSNFEALTFVWLIPFGRIAKTIWPLVRSTFRGFKI